MRIQAAHAGQPSIITRVLAADRCRALWRCNTQARDFGWLDAATAAQLEAPALLRRTDLVTDSMRRVRASLASRAPASIRARGSRHGALGFASLPHAVALLVFSFLPADARARATVVSRAWRAAVLDPSLWTRLDLSPASGVKQPVSDAMLRGAAALARGALEVLVLDDCVEPTLTQEARLEVVAANAGSLRKLSCCYDKLKLGLRTAEAMSIAAPQMQLFRADTVASVADAIRMLRNEQPFGALQLRRLRIEHAMTDAADEATMLELAAALSGHASMRELEINGIPLSAPNALDAVAAAAVACRLHDLLLIHCRLSPASIPALASVIRGGALTALHIFNNRVQLLDEPTAVQLADAISASHTLTRFVVQKVGFWRDGAAAAAVLRALTGHPAVREIGLINNASHDPVAAGAALAALVAANTPALQGLHFHSSHFGDAGLAPLFDALPHNTHLRELRCSNTSMSADFARSRFLPAVRANTSLRTLRASAYWGNQEDGVPPPEVLEAEALVAARSALDDDA